MINLSFEKYRSALATVTGIVGKRTSLVISKDRIWSSLSNISSSNSFEFQVFLSQLYAQVQHLLYKVRTEIISVKSLELDS